MAIPIISQIISLVRNIRNGSAFSPSIRTNIIGMSSPAVYPDMSQETALKDGFNDNTAIYSIIKKDAKKFASIARYVEEKETGESLDDSTDIMKLLNRPNAYQSQDAFLTIVRACFKLFGEAFIWLNRGDVTQAVDENGNLIDRTPEEYAKQPVLEMFVIPANHIIVVPDPENIFGVNEYQLTDNLNIKFRKEDIIHWKDINLDFDLSGRSHLRGKSPLIPGRRTLTADNAAIDSQVRMHQNDGSKAIVFNESMAPETPHQRSQREQVFADKINNKERKNSVAALQGKWGMLNLGLTSVDMDTLKGREFIYKELCFLLDVPYLLFDSEAKYSNQPEVQKNWINNDIKPACLQFDGELSRVLLPSFGLDESKVRICSDFDDLPELQEDKGAQVDWMVKAGFSPNQILDALGYEKNSDPAMDEVYWPSNLVPITGEAAQNAQMITDIQNMTNAANGTANTAAANGRANTGNGYEKVSGN